MRVVGDFEQVIVAGRRPERVEALAREIGAKAVGSVKEAVRTADVVCTVTNAREPIIHLAWLKEGAHVNAVGSSIASTRELASDVIAAGSLFVDRRESAVNEAGDYLLPLKEGAITPDHIQAELGEVLLGMHPGRVRDDELTIFKSLGVAVEDLAGAEYAVRRARELGRGVMIEL